MATACQVAPKLTMKVCPSWYARYRIQNLQGEGIRLVSMTLSVGALQSPVMYTLVSKAEKGSTLLTT